MVDSRFPSIKITPEEAAAISAAEKRTGWQLSGESAYRLAVLALRLPPDRLEDAISLLETLKEVHDEI